MQRGGGGGENKSELIEVQTSTFNTYYHHRDETFGATFDL